MADAILGTFLLGEMLLGSGNIAWTFEVDWNDDGSYTDESANFVNFSSFRGRREYISAAGDGINPFGTGTALVTLDNSDRRYDAWYSSSPIYPDCEPGKRARVKATIAGTTYNVFAGITDSPVQKGGRKNPEVLIKIVDGWRWLRDSSASTALYTDITTDTAIGHILDDIDWPAAWGRSLGTALETIPYWWGNGRGSHLQIADLSDSELGMFYIDASGKAVFKNRHTLEAAVQDLTQASVSSDMAIPQPWDTTRNIVTVKFTPRAAQSTQTIWEAYDIPSIPAGGSITIWADYSYNGFPVPAENVVTPVATTDYTMNTKADGTGTDRTASCTVTPTKFADTCKLVIANGHASDTVYVTKNKLRGDPIPSQTSRVIGESAEYATKPRELKLELPWLQDTNVAVDFANYLSSSLGNPSPYPIITLTARAGAQLDPDISDVINFASDYYSIDEAFRVGGIEHKWLDSNGAGLETTFYLEKFLDPEGFWVFPTSIGETSIFGW